MEAARLAAQAAKLGKPESELMMNAPALYREQVEEIDLVDKAIPAEKKFGSEVCTFTTALFCFRPLVDGILSR